MDWAHLLSEGWRFVGTGGLGLFIGGLFSNWRTHRAAAVQAKLDRDARGITSRRDRTYVDAKKAYLDAVGLLNLLHQATTYNESDDPSETFAAPAAVSTVEASLSIFGSKEAAQVFRAAADNYCGSWRDYRTSERFGQDEVDFYTEYRDILADRPPHQQVLEDMKKRTARLARDSRDKYQRAEQFRELLTELATAHLSREVELS